MRVYYLAARPYFIADDEPRKPLILESGGFEIHTEPFFVNTKNKSDFQVRHCIERFAARVGTYIKTLIIIMLKVDYVFPCI